MIKNHSIFFTITITFLVSIILIIVSFTILYKSSEKREEYFITKRNIDVSKMVLRECTNSGVSKELRDDLNDMDFSIITDPRKQNLILKDKDIIIKYTRHRRRAVMKYLKLNDKYIIYINTPHHKIVLIDNRKSLNNQQTVLLAIFSLILFAFILLYITTINKLKPLKTLKDDMKNLANEDFNVSYAITKKDEISQLANEFDKTAKKLKNIKESRNIFIRNIMHELKTPITKGKFLTQLPQTEQNNDKMQKVFYRLESLISEFATIEELISTRKVLNKKEYYLVDVIDNASDLLMCDEDEIVQEFENIKINIDFNLFSIAVKNLLDNGIKYSEDNKVIVKTNNKQIIFENKADKLSYPLESYFEPFFKGDQVKSNQSFGLGLYIVNHILKANNYKLEYEYKNGMNIFTIDISS